MLHQVEDDRWQMVFPYADGDTLEGQWESTDPDDLTPMEGKWFVDQYAGVSSALEEIHETTSEFHCGAHTGLKPEKILLFDDDTPNHTLRIADMGLEPHRMWPAGTRPIRGQLFREGRVSRYTAPFMGHSFDKNEERPRESDILALGCILLEHVIWVMSGYDALVHFRHRTELFWDHFQNDDDGSLYVGIHGYAGHYIELTLPCLDVDTAYTDILLLVRDHMLVWPTPADAKSVRQTLERIGRKCGESLHMSYTRRPDVLEFPKGLLDEFDWKKKSQFIFP
ncbi:hypothetical protein PG991_006401 [Apiospora marii]|uniref:Protein kinase domain-containing protein n=2 Tax=Apiospora marii TaxID=335849 RepID=A0ABR1SBW5_9PEZI